MLPSYRRLSSRRLPFITLLAILILPAALARPVRAQTSGNDTLNGTSGPDTIHGLAGNDTINGGQGNDALYGDEDDDIITGGADNDWIDGGAGNDEMFGNTGDDVLVDTIGDDILNGGSDADYFELSIFNGAGGGSPGTDAFDGGPGVDWFLFSGLSQPITVDWRNGVLSGPDVGTDTFAGVEFAENGNGNDTFINGPGDQRILQAGADPSCEFCGVYGAGSDTYQFAFGFGNFEIGDWGTSGDKLIVEGPANYEDIRFAKGGSPPELTITSIAQSGSAILLSYFQAVADVSVEEILIPGLVPITHSDIQQILDNGGVIPESFEAPPTVGLVGPDFNGMVYVAKEDDSDVRIGLFTSFTGHPSLTPRIIVEGLYNPDTGLPSDWTKAVGGGSYDASAGSWAITSFAGGSGINTTPHFAFANNSDTNALLTIRAEQVDGSNAVVTETSVNVVVKIDAVADTPDLAVAGALFAVAGENTLLSVAAALNDEDGSEELAVELRGLPAGASANLGQETAPGVWRIEGTDLDDLATLTVAFAGVGQFPFSVAAIAAEVNLDDLDDETADNLAETTQEVTADVIAPDLCPAAPDAGCLPAASAQLTLKDAADPAKDKIKGQWKGETVLADFADPLTDAAFGLCVYDKAGARIVAAEGPAGGLCPSGTSQKPCWKAKPNSKGFTFTDHGLEPDGIQKATLNVTKPGKANGLVQLQGKGGNLPLPGPQEAARYLADGATAATLQIHRLDAAFARQCWTASLGDEKKNTATDYSAKCKGAACAP